MAKERDFRRPNPLKMVQDPDLQLSLQQTQELAHLRADLRRQVLGNVLRPKLEERLAQEGLKRGSAVLRAKGQELLDLVSDYLLYIHLLPMFGERASQRAFLRSFEKHAQKFKKLVDQENYCNLVSGLAFSSDFSNSMTQVFVLNKVLDSTIAAAQKTLKVLSSHQLSADENARQHLAWSVADIVESQGEELHADVNSLYVRILRACVCALHAKPGDSGPEVLRLARNVIKKRKLDGVCRKTENSVEDAADRKD